MNPGDKNGEVDVSVVGPAMNEVGNLREYVDRCLLGFRSVGLRGEVVVIDDGSTDETGAVLQEMVSLFPGTVRGFAHRSNLGLTAALKTGLRRARGKYVIWLPTDLESHPDEDIPVFVEGFREGNDVVAGARVGRGDNKDFASRIYNGFCRHLFGLRLRDMNWTKGFRRECLEFLELRGDWHRFILVMLHVAGFRIGEKDMRWYPRKYGRSKFGAMRFPRAMVDALSVWFMLLFSRRPMRLFGTIGGIAAVIGLLTHLGLVLLFLLYETQIRPLFWSALVLELFAVQMVMFGFVSELVERVRDDLESLRGGLVRHDSWAVEILPGPPASGLSQTGSEHIDARV